MSFKKSFFISLAISTSIIGIPHLSLYLTGDTYVNNSDWSDSQRFFIIWFISCPSIYILSKINRAWSRVYYAHQHNISNGHDSYNEAINENDEVEVLFVISEGTLISKSKIVMHNGYLKCKINHEWISLGCIHKTPSIKIKKLKK